MPYADTLAALGAGAPPSGAMTPPADAPPPRAPSAYQGTLDALNAALAPAGGSAPGSDAPSTLTIQHGPTYGHTAAAIDAIMNAPPGTRIIAGAAPTVPAELQPPAGGKLYSDADLGLSYPTGPAAPPTPAASRSQRLYSDEELGLSYPSAAASPAPAAAQPDSGPLSNAPGDGWTAGALKSAGTAAVKAVGNVAGFVGGLSGLEDYLLAKGQSVVTGQTMDQAMADLAARRAKTEAGMAQSPLGRLASASDPTKVLPSPDDVSAPILARTGQYVPTSEVGRLAQAGTEAALSSVGPGMGAVSPGTAGKALLGTLARQAPAMAAAGAASQGAVDATGSPLAGLVAGVATPAIGEAVGAGVRGVGKLVAPVAGGSKLRAARWLFAEQR